MLAGTETLKRCDCPPSARPRMCPECPFRKRLQELREAEELGLDIPTFLRPQGATRGGKSCCDER